MTGLQRRRSGFLRVHQFIAGSGSIVAVDVLISSEIKSIDNAAVVTGRIEGDAFLLVKFSRLALMAAYLLVSTREATASMPCFTCRHS